MFQAHFVLFLYQPWDQPFLQGVLAPFREEWYLEGNIWMLIVLIAIGMLLFPGPLEKKKACVHLCMYTNTFTSLFLYQSIFIENHEFTVRLPIQVQYQGSVLVLSLSLFVMPFPCSEKPGLCQYPTLHRLPHSGSDTLH